MDFIICLKLLINFKIWTKSMKKNMITILKIDLNWTQSDLNKIS